MKAIADILREAADKIEAGDNEEQAWALARAAHKRDLADCRNPSLKSLAVNQLRQALGVWPNA